MFKPSAKASKKSAKKAKEAPVSAVKDKMVTTATASA